MDWRLRNQRVMSLVYTSKSEVIERALEVHGIRVLSNRHQGTSTIWHTLNKYWRREFFDRLTGEWDPWKLARKLFSICGRSNLPESRSSKLYPKKNKRKTIGEARVAASLLRSCASTHRGNNRKDLRQAGAHMDRRRPGVAQLALSNHREPMSS